MMHSRRFAKVAASCGTVVLAGLAVVWLAGFGSAGIENSGAGSIENRAASLTDDVELAIESQATDIGNAAITTTDVPTAPESMMGMTDANIAPSDEPESIVQAALPDPLPTLPADLPPVQLAAANPSDGLPKGFNEAAGSIDNLDECLLADICVDRYLWALYQRASKVDTIKMHESRKVTVRKKGKTVTITRSFTKLVDEDFTWKDPKAAEKAGMPMLDYVIGGMDRSFKLKLFHALRAAEEAGLSPGITSAFRDDYRQSIASGLKAASNKSYHGGSFRGGYGHGLAADVVSVKGATQAQRWLSTESFWKWIDAHGKEFGIGRPYLDKDPPHVAPIDGKEYAAHRGGAKAQKAGNMKKRNRLAARNDLGAVRSKKRKMML
jgi:hypothetical protein